MINQDDYADQIAKVDINEIVKISNSLPYSPFDVMEFSYKKDLTLICMIVLNHKKWNFYKQINFTLFSYHRFMDITQRIKPIYNIRIDISEYGENKLIFNTFPKKMENCWKWTPEEWLLWEMTLL